MMVLLLGFVWLYASSPLEITLTETITARDTMADSICCETTYTATMDISGFKTLQFYCQVDSSPGIDDTDWVNDTFFVAIQISILKDEAYHWKTYTLDTFLTTDSAYQGGIFSLADSNVCAERIRGRIIHWDSVEASRPGIFENVYGKRYRLWVKGFKN